MGQGIVFAIFVIVISAGISGSDSTCSCNGKLHKKGAGECWDTIKKSGKSFCFVNKGDCHNQKKSASMPGWFWSYQACEVSGYNPSLPGYLTTEEILGVKAIAGTNNYVEYYPGNMNLILSSPHGGKLRPFPERTGTYAAVFADKYTKEFSIGVIKHIENITGRRPHFVVNNVFRNCLEPNSRDGIDGGTEGRPAAVTAFKEYHAFIDQAMLAEGIQPHLKISSSGAGLTSNIKSRMGDYYLSVKRYNDFPVYVKLDNSQVIFVNDHNSWSISWKLQPKKRTLRNKEKGGASASPPVGGWEYWNSGRSRWVKDPEMKVELIAPPYVTVSSGGARVKYLNSNEVHNDHPVYKKEDNSEVMFVNNNKEWVVFNTIDPKDCTLRSTFGLTATPPQDGWQFCDDSRLDDDSNLRVDPPSALLIDMHGHGHAKNASEIGYCLNAKQLNESSYTAEDTGIFGLIKRSGMSAAQVIHGNKSLGAMFNDAGYAAFPSKNQTSPGKDKYFNGGYTVRVHGSRGHGGPTDALQVEFPSQLRSPKIYAQSIRDRLVLDLAKIFQQFHQKYYGN